MSKSRENDIVFDMDWKCIKTRENRRVKEISKSVSNLDKNHEVL